MKYASNGTRIWTQMAGANGDDMGYAVAVDIVNGEEVIYVTGQVADAINGENFAGGYDIVLMKYASDGSWVWTRMAGSLGTDITYGVAVDAANFVYVTGIAAGSMNGAAFAGGDYDILLMKYASDGAMVWTQLVGSRAAGDDRGNAIAVDLTDNCIYLTGQTSGMLNNQPYSNGAYDIFVSKFSSNGTMIWTRLTGTGGADIGNGIAVAKTGGAVYVTGTVAENFNGQVFNGGRSDIVSIKYSSSGSRLWSRIAGSTGDDFGMGITVDENDFMYVVGSAQGSLYGESYIGSYDVFMISYTGSVPTSQPSSSPTMPTSQPSTQPSGAPSAQPTRVPSVTPSGKPSRKPSTQPSSYPSGQPSMQPTAVPSQPSGQPSSLPTSQPSAQPSGQPTSKPVSSEPSGQPTLRPSSYPSCQPSGQPSSQPTVQPSQPSAQPSTTPTTLPSSQPTGQPSNQPTAMPSSLPTSQPSAQPSAQPSCQPSGYPSSQPTAQPTGQPSVQPSRQPSQPSGQPSVQPSARPSSQPTGRPSAQPSRQPTGNPTCQPTAQPSSQPTGKSSGQPTSQPSSQPTCEPSMQPSARPTRQPSAQPSIQPSAQPSGCPTTQPSAQPSSQPSCQPSAQPSARPTSQPTGHPTGQPSVQPTSGPSGQPTGQPSAQPTSQPSCYPTTQPSTCPSSQPSGQPSIQPSSQPSVQPTSRPTGQPTCQPSMQPSAQPSGQPSAQPSIQPSAQPSGCPTAQPSVQPSGQPSCQPSAQPSSQPTSQPTGQPTGQPSVQPTSAPSGQPTCQPSVQPSDQPSVRPTIQPSTQPSAQPSRCPTSQPSAQPSRQPSCQPTSQPTGQPSTQPTSTPTAQPTYQPSSQPSSQPLAQPTARPSAKPTGQPAMQPSSQPSIQPSRQPSCQPSVQPSGQPTGQPSAQPTGTPTAQPTYQPSSQPSSQPIAQPTAQPSAKPTGQPSMQPSSQPSIQPSRQPSCQPSAQPSGQPTSQPTGQPTGQPSVQPTSQPSSQPTAQPSTQPSTQPSVQPTVQPSAQPTAQPSAKPTSQPTVQPSVQPSLSPTSVPSIQPSAQPSGFPTMQPSGKPSIQPTGTPSSQPSSQPTTQPTSFPTTQPSSQSSCQPTYQPSVQPSLQPSSQPSALPFSEPTGQPSVEPSMQPIGQPTRQPSKQPSSQPSGQPSRQPSAQPSMQPSASPKAQPTSQPSGLPTVQPSMQPFSRPSSQPSRQPSEQPLAEPSAQPTSQPTAQPSCQPLMQPSSQPTSQPFARPSTQPSSQPSTQPTSQPTVHPTIRRPQTRSPTISRSPSIAPSFAPTIVFTFFSITPGLGGVGTNSIAGNSTTPAVNASLAIGVLSSLSGSQSVISAVTDDVRVVSQVIPRSNAGAPVTISLPLTEQEAILQSEGKLVLPSISLAGSTSENSSSTYVAVALLSSALWTPPVRSWNSSVPGGNNQTVPPLASEIGRLQSDVITVVTIGAGIDFVDIGFPLGTTAGVNATPSINFTIYCPPRVIAMKTFYCNDTGFVERVQCTGKVSVVRGVCPKLKQTCAALDLSSMTVARENICQTFTQNATTAGNNGTSSNPGGLVCRCSFGEGLSVPGSSMIAAGVVLGLVSSDLGKTFEASSAFGDGSAATKAAIVLSTFIALWTVGLVAVLYFFDWQVVYKMRQKSQKNKVADENLGQDPLAHDKSLLGKQLSSLDCGNQVGLAADKEQILLSKLAESYLTALFPAVFQPSSLLEGFCREIYRKHVYINIFFRLHKSPNPVMDIIKIVTLQGFLLFLLAFLYDLNYPSDDGSCPNLMTEVGCLQRRSLLDPTQTYCKWTAFQYAALLDTDDDAVYFDCVYGEPVASVITATYTSMILSLASCLLIDPLEFVLSLLAAPAIEEEKPLPMGPRGITPPNMTAVSALSGSADSDTRDAALVRIPSMTVRNGNGTHKSGSSRNSPSVFRIIPTQLSTLSAKCAMINWNARQSELSNDDTLLQNGKVLKRSDYANGKGSARKLQSSSSGNLDLITSLEAAVLSQRSRLIATSGMYRNEHVTAHTFNTKARHPTHIMHFDAAWCIDNATGSFQVLKVRERSQAVAVSQPSDQTVISMRDVIRRDLMSVQQESDSILEELAGQALPERGFEIMIQFVQDLLGRNSAAGRIFAMKIEMDNEKLLRVRKWVKVLIVVLLVCLNGFFFFFTILRGVSKGSSWQRSYLTAWLLQSALDICVFETMQCAWFHYFIPSLARDEVCAAKAVLEETVAKAAANCTTGNQYHRHHHDEYAEEVQLNAPDYLFVSCKLAKKYPELAESFVVQHYRASLPGEAGVAWKKLVDKCGGNTPIYSQALVNDVEKNDNAPNDTNTQQDRVSLNTFVSQPSSLVLVGFSSIIRVVAFVRYSLLAFILQIVILAPLQVQSLLTRVVEPVAMSGVWFFFLTVASRPVYLALTVVLFFLLAVSIVWEHVNVMRERKRTASDNADRLRPDGQQQSGIGTGQRISEACDAAVAETAASEYQRIEDGGGSVMPARSRSGSSSASSCLLDFSSSYSGMSSSNHSSHSSLSSLDELLHSSLQSSASFSSSSSVSSLLESSASDS